ncbi:serine hydrolase domain-containing protein [Nocardiopsis trehalosi]|uniref:serine hydrolase domain-containing protein n=1 Tax=Nocardiopsis trehalosi TaxID=109329 RepID=UPI00082AED7E|nr:serine hydrolase domain-containing protein [Nocardiopsis trehalosi]
MTTPRTHPANNAPADLDARLTTLLHRLVTRPGIHHATLAAADDTHHWSAAAGPADDHPPHPDTPFFIASVTKRFIITLLLQAHERRELDLDTPITAYLPADTTTGLHVLDGTDHTPAITVRHLASHTSGLPDQFEKRSGGPSLYDHLATGRDTAWTFDDTLHTTRQRQRPHFPPQDLTAPRQKARYSDTGFQLLIRILQATTGRTFPELLTERITTPLGLTRTWLPGHTPPDPTTPEPTPLHARRRPVHLPALTASTNDLYSTTGDLITFQRALLAGDLHDDPRTLHALTERRNRLRNIPVLHYGLGTMSITLGRLATAGRRPLTLTGHSGATGTWLFHCPELRLHLAGTVDQTRGQALPFRTMARVIDAWRR